MSIATDFADFGTDIIALKKRLRTGGAHVHFPEYGKDYRRRVGIESEQAMELFHQAVSMKAVGNLNDFVRGHMLEPFDASGWTARLVKHFEDLTKAHEAVLKAQAQLGVLAPLISDCERHDAIGEEIGSLAGQLATIRFYRADGAAALYRGQISELRRSIAERDRELARVVELLRELRDRERRLERDRAGLGGDRLGELDRLIAADENTREARRRRSDRYQQLLTDAGIAPVETSEQFADRVHELAEAAAIMNGLTAELQNRLTDVSVGLAKLTKESKEVNDQVSGAPGRGQSSAMSGCGLDKQILVKQVEFDP